MIMFALTTFYLCRRINYKYCPLKRITHCKYLLVWYNAKCGSVKSNSPFSMNCCYLFPKVH